jgi:uncharacterized protein YegP (UPF0339 family)
MRLEIHQDNSADYHWSLVTEGGDPLAKSIEAFASRGAAVQAASDLSEQVAAAPMEVS